jgi:uncharacterized protein YutE (UPF0331/DUF86 family)
VNLVAAAKITSLQRCVARAREAHALAGANFHKDFNLQDATVLNAVRACETAIDLATMAVRARHLGMPAESRELFVILEREGFIGAELSQKLRSMVGFRNLAVHQYRDIDLAILTRIVQSDLDDVLLFGQIAGRLLGAIE